MPRDVVTRSQPRKSAQTITRICQLKIHSPQRALRGLSRRPLASWEAWHRTHPRPIIRAQGAKCRPPRHLNSQKWLGSHSLPAPAVQAGHLICVFGASLSRQEKNAATGRCARSTRARGSFRARRGAGNDREKTAFAVAVLLPWGGGRRGRGLFAPKLAPPAPAHVQALLGAR